MNARDSDASPAIRVAALHKHFGKLHALKGVDLVVRPGEFFGLLGPNGAGKTTLISVLAGLTRADAGRAEVMGFDVVRDYRAARRALGVVPQELVYDPFFNVREALRIQSGYFGLRKNGAWVDEIIERLGLTDKAGTNLRRLSGGMKRRVMVAQALVHKPPVIVLDEPTAGVDVELRQSLWDFIRQLNRDGHTIVLTTHYLEEAEELCNRIAMLKQGQVVALDSTENLLRDTTAHHVRLKLDPMRLPPSLQARLVVQDRESFTLELDEPAQLEGVFAALREAGVRVESLETPQLDLEDVFIRTMARH